MKLQIAVIAVMVFLAIGLYLYINPVERAKPLFHKSVEESVGPTITRTLMRLPRHRTKKALIKIHPSISTRSWYSSESICQPPMANGAIDNQPSTVHRARSQNNDNA